MSDSQLRAGFAVRTINPPPGLPLVGYPKERPNVGVAMDLCARAVAFGSTGGGKPTAALVVLDTIDLNPEFVADVREHAAKRVPALAPESLMVIATHTHSAPTVDRRRFNPDLAQPAEKYRQHTVTAAADAVAAAWAEARPVRLRVGRTELRLGHNRRVVDPQGQATNIWLDLEGEHRGYFNPNVRLLLLEDADTAQPRGVIWVYGVHPVTLGPSGKHASADYPGYAIRRIESSIPGCCAIHLTGAAAQINPRDALHEQPEKAAPLGETLAAAILEELPHARPVDPVPLLSRVQELTFPLRPGAKPSGVSRTEATAPQGTITSHLQVIRLGSVALISTPGETFAELGVAIENTSPFATTFVIGYANDHLGYLCTDTAVREGGYEARIAVVDEVEQRLIPATRQLLMAGNEKRPT